MIKLKHIALEITGEDLHNFYEQVLEGEIQGSFILNQEVSTPIFGIHKEILVYYLKVQQIEFELFVREGSLPKLYNHTCLEVSNAHALYAHAKANNYWVYEKHSSKTVTYFIKDKKGNLFELKQKREKD